MYRDPEQLAEEQSLIARLTIFAALHRGFSESTPEGGICLGPKDVAVIAQVMDEAAEMLRALSKEIA